MRKLLLILLFIPFFSQSQTAVFTCGFEDGVSGAHWTLGANASFSTSTVRSATRSVRLNPAASAGGSALSYALGTQDIFVIRVYVRFAALPSTFETNIAGLDNGTSFVFGALIKHTDNKIYANANFNYGTAGPTMVINQWYLLDIKINLSANPRTVDVSVDGVAIGQATQAAAATSHTAVRLGMSAFTNTMDAYYDDFLLSHTVGDYPIGSGYVNHFIPTSDGTHNVAGTDDFERSATGTDITNATTTAYQLIDDEPLKSGTPTEYIKLIAPVNATDYVEVVFGPATGISTPTTAPRAVEVIVASAAVSSTANNLRVALNDNGSTDDVRNATVGSTTAVYSRKLYIDPPSAASVWTLSGNGNFNNIRMRCYTNDANPDPHLASAMIEAEFSDVVLTVPGTPSDKRHTNLGVGMVYSQNIFNTLKLTR